MRVISGIARGRSLKAVAGIGTRPTTDKVKEAIFSMIGPYFDGGLVLDLFAGTGGLGIEALSRGMDQAVFIDREAKSVETVRHNLQSTGFSEKAELYRNDAMRALKTLSKRGLKFHLVFLDPPYRLKMIGELITELISLELLADNAVIVAEHDVLEHPLEAIDPFIQSKRAEYGDIAVTVYHQSDDGQ
jgi:16S rRNA (guanine966-N2)-methyltransferase